MLELKDLGIQSGYEALSPTSATGFTESLINPTSGIYKGMSAKAVVIGVETHPIRFLLDGTAPEAASGMLLKADKYSLITGMENIRQFKCIDTAAGASSVKVLVFF